MAANGIKAGSAFVELSLDADKMRAGLGRAQRSMGRLAGSVGRVGAAFTGLGLAAATPFIAAVKSASDMQEVMNKFNVVFKGNQTAVKAWADEFASSVGRSKLQIAGMLAETQDLLKPMGFASEAATEMSKEVSKLAIDLASFNNLADADVLRDLKAALTGSGEVMKKYGVIVSQAAIKQEALNEGLDPKILTEMEKAQLRWNIILRGTVDAQGDAERSGGSLANRIKALQGQLSDMAVAVGQALLPTVEKLAGQLADAGESIGKWIENNGELIPQIAAVAAGLTAFGIALSATAVGLVAASTALGAFSTIVGVLATPLGAIVIAMGALGVAALVIGTDFETMGGQVEGAVADIRKSFEAGGLEAAWETIWISIQQVALEAMAGVLDGFATMIRTITQGPKGILKGTLLGATGEGAALLAEGGAGKLRGDAKDLTGARHNLVGDQQAGKRLDDELKKINEKREEKAKAERVVGLKALEGFLADIKTATEQTAWQLRIQDKTQGVF